MTVLPPILVVRPEPGNAATVSAGRALGLNVVGQPIFTVQPVDWDCPDPQRFSGLIVGSANVFRHGGARLDALRSLPVHVVGTATSQEAERAGFQVATIGAGGLQTVLDQLSDQHLLRLSGAEHVPLNPPHGTTIATRVVYEVKPHSLPAELIDVLNKGAMVLLHSGEAAKHFALQCDAAMIQRGHISLACLAPRIAQSAGNGWKNIEIAKAPTDSALLALATQMCQNASARYETGPARTENSRTHD